jgi:uncharacterized protein YjbI with pentapeptide repeats
VDTPSLTQDLLDRQSAAHERLLTGKPEGFRADFRNTSLAGLTLNGRNLSESLFAAARLDACKLINCDLSQVDFAAASLVDATLVRCVLRHADLRGCNLTRTKFIACDLTGADFRELALVDADSGDEADADQNPSSPKFRPTLLTDADFSGSKLVQARLGAVQAEGACFADVDLSQARFNRAVLPGARFQFGILDATDFSGSNLSEADFRDCSMDNCKLEQAKVDGILTGESRNGSGVANTYESISLKTLEKRVANHVRACETNGARGQAEKLDGIDLRALKTLSGKALTAFHANRANLSGMNFEGAELQGASFKDADMRGIRLRGADLRGADLSGALLTHADFRDCRLDPLVLGANRVLPSSLENTMCRYADMRGANLNQAKLANSNLSHSRLDSANLEGADLTGANLDDCIRG